MVKKIALVFGILAVLIVGTLVVIPMIYSIDSLRPQVQAAIEKSIRGKVVLGKLSLSLLPSIAVKVDGVTVKAPPPFDKEALATIQSVEVKMPLSSLLGAPYGTLVIGPMKVKMISEGLKSNLAETLPPPKTEVELKAIQTEAKKASALEDTLKGLPAFLGSRIAAARFDFVMEKIDAEIVKLGAPKGDHTRLKNFSVRLSGIGIATDMKLLAEGDVDVAAAGAQISGPIKTTGSVKYRPVGRDHELTMALDNDLKALDLALKPLFHKVSGVAFGASMSGVLTAGIEKTDINLSKLKFQFANVEVEGSVKANMDAIDPTKGEFNANFAVDNFSLAAWGSLVPMVRDFKLGGKVGMAIKTWGPFKNPSVDVAVNLSGVTGSTPTLQKPLSDLNGKIHVTGTATNPKIDIDPFNMKLGSGDISFKMATEGLEAISAKIFVGSNNLDADELLGISPEALLAGAKEKKAALDKKGGKAGAGSTGGEAPSAEVKPGVPLDDALGAMAPMIEAQLDNPMIDKLSASIATDFKKIKIMGALLTNATFNMTFAKRKLTINKTGLDAFGGKVLLEMGLDLNNPKALGYSMNAGMTSVDVGQMVSLYAPKFKNDVSGALTGNFSIAGAGLRKEQLEKSLSGGLKGSFVNGRFSLPFMNLAMDAGEESLKAMADKGGLLGKGAAAAAGAVGKESGKERSKNGGEFKTAKVDSVIKGRQLILSLLEIEFKEEHNRPANFKGKGSVTFDRAINFEGLATVYSENPKFECVRSKANTIETPLRVGGTMDVPKVDYAFTAQTLATVCAKKAGQKAVNTVASKAIDEAAKKMGIKDQKKIEDIKSKAGGALNKLFGH